MYVCVCRVYVNSFPIATPLIIATTEGALSLWLVWLNLVLSPLPDFLNGCEIKSGSGLGMRLSLALVVLLFMQDWSRVLYMRFVGLTHGGIEKFY